MTLSRLFVLLLFLKGSFAFAQKKTGSILLSGTFSYTEARLYLSRNNEFYQTPQMQSLALAYNKANKVYGITFGFAPSKGNHQSPAHLIAGAFTKSTLSLKKSFYLSFQSSLNYRRLVYLNPANPQVPIQQIRVMELDFAPGVGYKISSFLAIELQLLHFSLQHVTFRNYRDEEKQSYYAYDLFQPVASIFPLSISLIAKLTH